MPLIEIATVRLHATHASNSPEAFTSAWTKACQLATKAANGVPFQLYHAVPPADDALYYLIGGWKTGDDHINFVSTPNAITVAKSLGEFVTVDVVRHVDGDIGVLDSMSGGRPKKLRAEVYKVLEDKVAEWETGWKNSRGDKGGSGGWDLSAEIQKQHQAFKRMGEMTNSVGAFGGQEVGGERTWVWVSAGERLAANADDAKAAVFEIEYFLG